MPGPRPQAAAVIQAACIPPPCHPEFVACKIVSPLLRHFSIHMLIVLCTSGCCQLGLKFRTCYEGFFIWFWLNPLQLKDPHFATQHPIMRTGSMPNLAAFAVALWCMTCADMFCLKPHHFVAYVAPWPLLVYKALFVWLIFRACMLHNQLIPKRKFSYCACVSQCPQA